MTTILRYNNNPLFAWGTFNLTGGVLQLLNNGIATIGFAHLMLIKVDRTVDLYAQNNSANTVTNVDSQILSYPDYVPEGVSNQQDLAQQLMTKLVKDRTYVLRIIYPAAPSVNNALVTYNVNPYTYVTDYFPLGFQLYPSYPAGITVETQEFGQQYFTFTNFSVTVGQQIALCFGTNAIANNSIVVTTTGGCVGRFGTFTQSFVTNNSVIVVATGISNGLITTGQFRVSLTNSGTAGSTGNLIIFQQDAIFNSPTAFSKTTANIEDITDA